MKKPRWSRFVIRALNKPLNNKINGIHNFGYMSTRLR
jgi:hypothetical protein